MLFDKTFISISILLCGTKNQNDPRNRSVEGDDEVFKFSSKSLFEKVAFGLFVSLMYNNLKLANMSWLNQKSDNLHLRESN